MIVERIGTLTDRKNITIRPLGRDDVQQLDALHQRLSPETIYRRYFSPRKPSCQELERVCQLNEAGGGALVAVHDDTVVGIAYYITVDGKTAEPAILIEDRFQRQGIGRRLVTALAQLALTRGVDTFSALILPENRAVLQLVRGSGVPYVTRFSHGAREVRVSLAG